MSLPLVDGTPVLFASRERCLAGEPMIMASPVRPRATSSVWLPVKVTAVQSKPMDKLNVGVATSITSATVRMHSSVRLLAVLRTLAPSVWMARSCAGEVMSTAEVPVRRVVGIAAAGGHSCALEESGKAHCWGFNEYNQTDVPDQKFKQIAPGYLHTCALDYQQEAICWGQKRGDNKPPSGRFRQISSRGPFTCALDMSGRAVCWPQADQREERYEVVSVGGSHFCGVQSSGQVLCRGRDDRGQSSPPSGKFQIPSKRSKRHGKGKEL